MGNLTDFQIASLLLKFAERIVDLNSRFARAFDEYNRAYGQFLTAYGDGDTGGMRKARATMDKALKQGDTFERMLTAQHKEAAGHLKSWKPKDEDWVRARSRLTGSFRDLWENTSKTNREWHVVSNEVSAMEAP